MNDARVSLDNDRILAEAMEASKRVVLPVFFKYTRHFRRERRSTGSAPESPCADPGRRSDGDSEPFPPTISPCPIDRFFDAAKGIGHINLAFDMDGTARRERLLYRFKGLYFPAYSLRLAAAYLNVPLKRIQAELGSAVTVGGIEIPTTLYTEMLVSFKGARNSFKRYSYFDVINDKIPLTVFKNKLVIVSPSASGIMNPIPTPVDASMPLGEFTANSVWAIVNQSFVQQPGWGTGGELLLILVLGAFDHLCSAAAQGHGRRHRFLAVIWWPSWWVAAPTSSWPRGNGYRSRIRCCSSSSATSGWSASNTSSRKRAKKKSKANRRRPTGMLGLSFQNQGMLDMAFDKFRRVPVDNEMKDILYNLALDFERKRQFNKAAAVFEYIEEHDAKFKDVADRKKKLMQASETMVFGEGIFGGSSRRRADGFRHRNQADPGAI